MREVLVVGIGAGNPDHLTLEAVKALGGVQVVFIPDKGAEKDDLRRLRREICDRFVSDGNARFVEFTALRREADLAGYHQGVAVWHDRIAAQYAALLRDEMRDGETGAFLVWGDPGLYDSTLRILALVEERGSLALTIRVIPGITSVQALAARHRIPLNRIGEPVHITTGRRLRDGYPEGAGTVVVMLDGEETFARLDRDDLDIAWGANIGLASERLVAGPLPEVRDAIARLRAEARREAGWVMDTYLLRVRRQP